MSLLQIHSDSPWSVILRSPERTEARLFPSRGAFECHQLSFTVRTEKLNVSSSAWGPSLHYGLLFWRKPLLSGGKRSWSLAIFFILFNFFLCMLWNGGWRRRRINNSLNLPSFRSILDVRSIKVLHTGVMATAKSTKKELPVSQI